MNDARHHSHRSRSRSDRPSHHRARSRSPFRHHRQSSHRKRTLTPSPPVVLPFNAPPIIKHHYDALLPVFTSYLDIQKNLRVSGLSHREARGRFKSFVSHYNRGELARGWYERVIQALREPPARRSAAEEPPPLKKLRKVENVEESDDEFIPPLPGQEARGRKSGPSAPKTEELQWQRELHEEDRELQRADLKFERKLDRKTQKEQLEELVPRAEPGTRERKIEKRKELNDKMRSFRERSPGGEVDEGTLMGGGGGESLAQKKAAMERKKNERELRREQMLKARIEEREERVQGMKEKEDRTMAMLKSLAASRFG